MFFYYFFIKKAIFAVFVVLHDVIRKFVLLLEVHNQFISQFSQDPSINFCNKILISLQKWLNLEFVQKIAFQISRDFFASLVQ